VFSRGASLLRGQPVLFVVLAVWAFWPLVLAAVHVASHGGLMTGTYGADFPDQFQYLAWIRDEGEHFLASNLWVIGPTPHDYLHPMYVISGGLWRLGLNIQLAYLVWVPVALLILFLGSAAYVRRLLIGRWQQAAALALILFYHSPIYVLSRWIFHFSPAHEFELLRTTIDADSALQLWGFAHAAITVGLMPLFLLAAEKQLSAGRQGSVRRWGAMAAVAGLLISWLHPWEGAIVLLVLGVLFVIRPPRRRFLVLGVPVVATVLPLLYTEILAHADSNWHYFQKLLAANTVAPLWAMAAAFGPLVLFAVLGLRRPGDDREWMLVLWPGATLLVYLFGPNTSPHALTGFTVPLSVLAVRGWERARARLRVPRATAAATAVAAILAFTIPAGVDEAQSAGNVFGRTISGALALQEVRLTSDQAKAMQFLDHMPRAGGVLTPWIVALAVPQFTDRPVVAGHQWWGPPSSYAEVSAFFDPSATGPAAARSRRAILLGSRAVFVLAPCGSPPGLGATLAGLAHPVKRFGCVTVYERN
jgi:hypothetical protein